MTEDIRAEPYRELQYAVNYRAIKDLAQCKGGDSALTLTSYLLTHYMDDSNKMELIVKLALIRRYNKLLEKIAKQLDNMEAKVNKMRMTLDDLFKDIEETAASVEKLNPAPETDKTSEADKIEEEMENADESTDADADEDGNTDDIVKEENKED